jgi:hypothetical protein
MDEAEAYLASETVTQYWARPRRPKDKPFVERVIRPTACCREEIY